MNIEKQNAQDIARDVITSFRDLDAGERAAKLASLSGTAEKSPTANSIRGKALIEFWRKVSAAVALDASHSSGTYSGTQEASQHRRDTAMHEAGAALFSYTVSIVPTTAAALLAGEPAPA